MKARLRAGIGFAMGVLTTGLFPAGCIARSMPPSDHVSGSRFHNRDNAGDYSLSEELEVGWALRTKKKNWPARFETTPYPAAAEPLVHGIRLQWIGHSTTIIQTPSLNIITDPVLFDSIGPRFFGINTVTNPGVLVDSLPTIHLILISHSHYDHLDLRSLRALVDRQRSNPPMILAGRGVGAVLRTAGLTRYTELDWNESVAAQDARVTFLEAVHTSRRGMWDTNTTLWGSFLIDSPDGRVYFAGDTAYGPHFRRVYDEYGAPTLSLLPIGAYEPRWFMSRMHMNPDEAVRAHLDLHSQHSIGIHFGLIDNAGESFEAPLDDLTVARRAHGVDTTDFAAPHYGQTFRY